MRLKLVCAFVLAVVFVAQVSAQTSERQNEEPQTLTPAEECEARELAARFVERFRQTDDIAPLVEELFVKDFGERLRHDDGSLPMHFVRREVARQASTEELRRFYVAEFNFFSLTLEYSMLQAQQRRDAGLEDDNEDSIEGMFPPDVLACLKDDPIFSTIIAEEEAKERKELAERAAQDTNVGAAGDARDTQGADDTSGAGEAGKATEQKESPEQEDEDVLVNSLADLRAAASATEKAAKALRAHVPYLLTLRRMQRERVDDEDFKEIHDPRLDTRDEAAYGFPAKTRFIVTNVEPLHDLQFYLVMVEADGRLQILSAFPIFGD